MPKTRNAVAAIREHYSETWNIPEFTDKKSGNKYNLQQVMSPNGMLQIKVTGENVKVHNVKSLEDIRRCMKKKRAGKKDYEVEIQ